METYSVTGMKHNLPPFAKSQMQLELNNSSVHSSFDRSELNLSTNNES